MFRSCLTAAAVATCVISATPSSAQPIERGGTTAAEIADWLRTQGLDAQVAPGAATPQVQSGANGVSWDINGFDCQADRCQAWQFSTAFLLESLDPAVINRWNTEHRYVRAFQIERDGRPVAVAQYDVLLVPGSTWEGLTQHMHLFAGTAPLFAVEIGAAEAAAD